MNNLPYEIKCIICDYTFHCKKDFLFIDKEFVSICKKKNQNCKYIDCFNTKLCKVCDEKNLKYISMLFQNFVPLYR